MRYKAFIFVLFLLLPGISNSQVPDSLKYVSAGPLDFQKAYLENRKALLVDVREFFEYKKSRIENAVNIPSSGNIDHAADTLNKELTLFLYCTTGFRSKRVAKELYDRGFLKPYSLEGGIKAWKKEGLPVNRKRLKKD